MTFPAARRGVTLVEMLIVSAIFLIVMGMLWRGVRTFQTIMAFQMRLERQSQALDLTQEIAQAVESARRVTSVGPDHLDLEVYDFKAYGLLDPRMYEQSRRVRYQVRSAPLTVTREIYISTNAAQPENERPFLTAADLAPPTETEPYFDASYLVAGSTVGIRIALRLRTPYAKEPWVPVRREVFVRAE